MEKIEMIKKIELSPTDKLILDLLKSSGRPLTTYEIAKKLEISWATVNVHCNKLRWQGVIKGEEKISKTGMKKIVWSAK